MTTALKVSGQTVDITNCLAIGFGHDSDNEWPAASDNQIVLYAPRLALGDYLQESMGKCLIEADFETETRPDLWDRRTKGYYRLHLHEERPEGALAPIALVVGLHLSLVVKKLPGLKELQEVELVCGDYQPAGAVPQNLTVSIAHNKGRKRLTKVMIAEGVTEVANRLFVTAERIS